MAFEKKQDTYSNPGGLIADIFKKKGEQDAQKEALKNKIGQLGSSGMSGVTNGVDAANIGSFAGIA